VGLLDRALAAGDRGRPVLLLPGSAAKRREVRRRLARDGAFEFSVAEDGAGFDPETTPHGAGTANMKDRLEALGGTLEVRSRPGEGTVIAGRIPAR
jgi:signal transduction histidine kinase